MKRPVWSDFHPQALEYAFALQEYANHIEEQNKLLSNEVERLEKEPSAGIYIDHRSAITPEEQAIINAAGAVYKAAKDDHYPGTLPTQELYDAVDAYLESVQPSPEEKFRETLYEFSPPEKDEIIDAAKRAGLL